MRYTHSAAILPYGQAGLRPMMERMGPATHVILRVGIALLFMQHGVQKLFGWLGGMGESGASAPLISAMGVAGVMEVFGGLLILTGFLTRPVALALFLEMLIAYGVVHMPQGGFPIQNGGELALLYAASFVFLFGNGAGPLSIDNWIAQKKLRSEAPMSRARFEREQPTAAPAPKRRDTAA
jgi:putative oxidoreductase